MESNLQVLYNEYRTIMEILLIDNSGSIDCGELRVREDFTEYANLEETISFEQMLELENNY